MLHNFFITNNLTSLLSLVYVQVRPNIQRWMVMDTPLGYAQTFLKDFRICRKGLPLVSILALMSYLLSSSLVIISLFIFGLDIKCQYYITFLLSNNLTNLLELNRFTGKAKCLVVDKVYYTCVCSSPTEKF
jgi:hypothetical protein